MPPKVTNFFEARFDLPNHLITGEGKAIQVATSMAHERVGATVTVYKVTYTEQKKITAQKNLVTEDL